MDWYSMMVTEDVATIDCYDQMDYAYAMQILRGESPIDHFFFSQINIKHKKKQEIVKTDCVSFGEIMISQRIKLYLESKLLNDVEYFPIKINDKLFYFYRSEKINCLDRINSEIEYFDEDKSHIMMIKRYKFFKDRISKRKAFSIPEANLRVFFSEDVALEFNKQKFVGCELINYENPPEESKFYIA